MPAIVRSADAPDCRVDRAADVGMAVVTQVAHVGGEIARPDEETVDAVDRRDVFEMVEGRHASRFG